MPELNSALYTMFHTDSINLGRRLRDLRRASRQRSANQRSVSLRAPQRVLSQQSSIVLARLLHLSLALRKNSITEEA
jgi:hypothetical protein